MKVVICDDEAVFLLRMKELIISTYPHKDKLHIYEFESGESLLKTISRNRYDIIFLDIEMNG